MLFFSTLPTAFEVKHFCLLAQIVYLIILLHLQWVSLLRVFGLFQKVKHDQVSTGCFILKFDRYLCVILVFDLLPDWLNVASIKNRLPARVLCGTGCSCCRDPVELRALYRMTAISFGGLGGARMQHRHASHGKSGVIYVPLGIMCRNFPAVLASSLASVIILVGSKNIHD